jgi:hypothetical protein
MATWSMGFTSRVGATRATRWGSVACFFQAVRETLANVFVVSSSGKPLDNAVVWFMGQSLIPILLVVAGIQLWRHKGWIWASVASAIVVLDLIGALLSTYPRTYATALVAKFAPNVPLAVKAALITGLIVKVGLVMLILNGARGAFALRNVDNSRQPGGASA